MNIFLAELSKNFSEELILIMDGAGWHKSKALVVPGKIQIVLLPPYCPELNPVEKLWKYVKDNTIKNKVFEVLSDLEDEVCQFLFELEIDVVKSICGVVY
jgi:transposase